MYLQAENAVSSFFFYMWNAWSEEECKAVYGNMYLHFWEKWCVAADKGTFGAAEGSIWNSRKTAAGFWWSEPSRYMTDDASETGTGIRPRPQGICHQPPRRGITDNSHDLFSEHTFAGGLEERIPPAGIAAPPGQGW